MNLPVVVRKTDDYGLFYAQKNVHHKCYHLIEEGENGKRRICYDDYKTVVAVIC